ncbi:MAG: helix-turn-helix domain-containing protein [Verrucomicrobia bacterium]|nr:helix-turn-helix domain-containing protein [Verrucomicrobiota bacterium]
MPTPAKKVAPAGEKPTGLDFPGRSTLYVSEVANKLCVSEQTILNLLECGQLGGIHIGTGNKKFWRIPVHEYEAFLKKRSSLNV